MLNTAEFTSFSHEGTRFFETGQGEQAIVFLHGLFGAPDHWTPIMEDFADDYRVVAVQFPIDRQPDRRHTGVQSIPELTSYVETVFDELGLQQAIICGNSLGGVVAIDFGLKYPDRVPALILSGSAGLHENHLAGGQRPRATREFVRTQAARIFCDQTHVTDELVDGLVIDLADRDYTRFVLRMAKATRNHCVKDDLSKLLMPTLLIWGQDDCITPPTVAEEFHEDIEDSRLYYVNECGHSPNLEHPEKFTNILREFLTDLQLPSNPPAEFLRTPK